MFWILKVWPFRLNMTQCFWVYNHFLDSGSLYGLFYKRQSFRSNRDSSNNNSLGSSSLNIPTAVGVQHPMNDSMDSASGAHPATCVPTHPSTHSALSLHRIAVQPRSGGSFLQRSHSEAQPEPGQLPERAMSIHLGAHLASRHRKHRRPSACVPGFRGG